MKIGECDVAVFLVVVTSAVIIGYAAGLIEENVKWRLDCDAMGQHRTDKIIYQCKEQK